VVLWAKRSLDPGVPILYQTSLASNQIKQIYLDKLEKTGFGSVPLDIVKLVVESEDEASKQIKPLIQRIQQEVTDESLKISLIELIEKVIVYKFGDKDVEVKRLEGHQFISFLYGRSSQGDQGGGKTRG